MSSGKLPEAQKVFVKRIIRYLGIGLKRYPLRFFKSWFLAYSAIWTILSSLAFFFPILRPTSWNVWIVLGLLSMVMVGLLWGLYRVRPRRSVQIRMKPIDVTIEVAFGDLFTTQGIKAIAVNEFFDSSLGEPVARSSLHGQLIERMFQDRPEQFDELVDKELRSTQFEETKRSAGRKRKYPIGTTPVVDVGTERFLLPALCETDVETYKAYCDIPMLLMALDGLWSTVRTRAGVT
ncbi:MAG: hypothetical protein H0T57_18110 [Rubrobacter sp.]|nr:hypothetical protein [Rubrobacter sp.]